MQSPVLAATEIARALREELGFDGVNIRANLKTFAEMAGAVKAFGGKFGPTDLAFFPLITQKFQPT